MTATTKKARNVKADLRRLADVVRREVDAGADTVEDIHRSIARMPLDVLAKLDVFEATIKDARKVQDASIGAIYELIHKVNREVTKLAKELLDGRERSRKRAKPIARKTAVSRKPAARAASPVAVLQPHG